MEMFSMREKEKIDEDLYRIRNLKDYLRKYLNTYKDMLYLCNSDYGLYKIEYPYSNYSSDDLIYAIKLARLYLRKFK